MTKYMTLSYLSFLSGLLFQLWASTRSFRETLTILGWGLGFSLFSFLPGKREHDYSLQKHLEAWPVIAVGAVVLVAVIKLWNNLVSPLYEGTLLVIGFAFTYWFFEHNRTWQLGITGTSILLLLVLPVFISAFSYWFLNTAIRLYFSLASSVFLLVLGVEFAYRVFTLPRIEDLTQTQDLGDAIYVAMQFFLLGTASIYLVYQIGTFTELLPGKNEKMPEYRDRIRMSMIKHIDRFSTEQIPISLSFVSLLVFGLPLAANYFYGFAPPSMAISAVLTFGPFVMGFGLSFFEPIELAVVEASSAMDESDLERMKRVLARGPQKRLKTSRKN